MPVQVWPIHEQALSSDRIVQTLTWAVVGIGLVLVLFALALLVGTVLEISSAFVMSSLLFLVMLLGVFAYLTSRQPRGVTPS